MSTLRKFAARPPQGKLFWWKKIVELPRETHPYFIATQFHPEFKSRPNHAHPLFAGLIEAALERKTAAMSVKHTANQEMKQVETGA